MMRSHFLLACVATAALATDLPLLRGRAEDVPTSSPTPEPCIPDAEHSIISRVSKSSTVEVMENINFKLQTANVDGVQCTSTPGKDVVSGKVTGPGTGRVFIKDEYDGSYTVTATVVTRNPGAYTLEVLVYGKPAATVDFTATPMTCPGDQIVVEEGGYLMCRPPECKAVADKSSLSLKSSSSVLKRGEDVVWLLQTRAADGYVCERSSGYLAVKAKVTGPGTLKIAPYKADMLDGSYRITVVTQKSDVLGTYTVDVTLFDKPAGSATFTIAADEAPVIAEI